MCFFGGFIVDIFSNASFVTFMLSSDIHHNETAITSTGNIKIDLMFCSIVIHLSAVVSENFYSYHKPSNFNNVFVCVINFSVILFTQVQEINN